MVPFLKSIFWANAFCCFLYLVDATTDDDLVDFDFTDLKEIDWNYEPDHSKDLLSKETEQKNTITFDDDSDLLEENQVHPFDWREKVLRTALSKALMNKAMRQKFVEVVPILRALSKQQRLALSALITSQINAKKGNELKLAQVRMMFGDDKSLILPIVFDIANLVRNSAKKYIKFDYNLADFGDFTNTKASYERRNVELSSKELEAEGNSENVGTLPAAEQMTQHFNLDDLEEFMSEEVLDPKEINEELELLKAEGINNTGLDNVNMDMDVEELDSGEEEEKENDDVSYPLDINIQLQNDVPTMVLVKETTRRTRSTRPNFYPTAAEAKAPYKRQRRSARDAKEFVHKLMRSVSFPSNDEDIRRAGPAGRTLKLNTTAFASPRDSIFAPNSNPAKNYSSITIKTTTSPEVATPEMLSDDSFATYQLIEDLAFATLNGSEILLDNNDDSDKEYDFTSDAKSEPDDEILPTPEELISGPRYRIPGNKLTPSRLKIVATKRKRMQVRSRPKKGTPGNGVAPPKKCERFTASMCIKTDDYPIDHIMGSIRRHRTAMTALLAEYDEKPSNNLDSADDFDEYLYGKKRREDNGMQGELCQSVVRYARPQKARSASGEWKYIVNTGQHTQTLRLEKCMNPQESCSYLATSYRSHCAQVYNYHRLLSWDKTRGLHVDIFKVPTCCSCQIDGYKQPFSLDPDPSPKGFTSNYKSNIFRPQHQKYDYNDDEEEDDDDFDFSIQRKHHKHDTIFDANDVSSNKIKSKVVAPPTVGSYLSPPVNEEYEEYIYNNPRETAAIVIQHSPSSTKSSSKPYLRDIETRRPHKFYKDSRSDQDLSPSEEYAEKEVKVFGTAIGKGESTHQKRNNIYSVTQTASTSSSGISVTNTTAFTANTGNIRAFAIPTTTTRQRRPPYTNTKAYKKPSFTTATKSLPTLSSSSAAATPIRSSATLPTHTNGTSPVPNHYYPRTRHVLQNHSRLRIPHTITSTNTEDNEWADIDTPPTPEYRHKIPTKPGASSSTQQSNVYAVNPQIFYDNHNKKFMVKHITTPTTRSTYDSYSSPRKRINYSYHPIIDFFQYNKRTIGPNNTYTAPESILTAPDLDTSPSRNVPSIQSPPHQIINKPQSVSNNQQHTPINNFQFTGRQQHNYQQPNQQLEYRPQKTERESDAAAAVAAATDGDATGRENSGIVSNIPKQNSNTQIDSDQTLYSNLVTTTRSSVAQHQLPVQSNNWQPLIVHNF